MKLILSETAFKQLSKLAPDIQSRISSKKIFTNNFMKIIHF